MPFTEKSRNIFTKGASDMVSYVKATKSALLLALGLLIVSSSLATTAELKKVPMGLPSFTLEQLPYQLAEKKGYFKEEGLTPEFVLMKSTTITQAMASQTLPYSMAATSGIAAAVSGIEAKVLWVASAKTLMFLMARPEIKQISDLKGKRIGVSGIGGSSDIGLRAMLSANGVNPKETTILAIGATESRLMALKTAGIDASPLSLPANFQAEPLGFKSLGFVGDYMPNAFGGLSIHTVALEKDPKLVHALVRVGLKGLKVMKHDKNFTVKILQSFANIPDPELAARIYEGCVGYFTEDGIISEKDQQVILEESKKQLKVDKPIPLTIFDFSFAQNVKRELSAWKP
jgi:NitT/TauT family transport system substrate-binding protein